jgi:DNA-binding PadR family transcriptional regulator
VPKTGEPRLSLPEWLVLCLISEKPSHGFALSAVLAREGSLGRIWQVYKPVVYRSLPRLEDAGLIQAAGPERSSLGGPSRTPYSATPAGRRAARAWLSQPVAHARDIRSELLLKLALLDRAGIDPQELLRAQRAQLEPIAAALDDRLRTSEGFDRTVILWRHEAMSATIRFLDSAGASA